MTELSFREARREDLPAIVAMLDDDGLGGGSEVVLAEGVDPVYEKAFEAVQAQKDNRIIVAERDGALVGTFQFTVIAGLLWHGSKCAQVEAVRVRSDLRGGGIGETMARHAIQMGRDEGCDLIQISSDKRRGRAHLFYERLGFVATHIGFKLDLK